ncbi:putative secreted repeat protein (TIGR03808 family) [Bradyrhizobium sp. USDA 4354]
MDLNRRHLIGASTAGIAGALAMPVDAARAAPLTSLLGRDATQYGVRPGSSEDQTRALQRAIDETARAQMPLALPPGVYRSGLLRLPNGAQLIGVRGATKLVFTGGASAIQSDGSDAIGLTGLTFDGGNIPLPTRRGLIHVLGGRDVRITDCAITGSGGSGIWLEQVAGDISGNIFTDIAVTAVVSFDARGLSVCRNTILGTNDNGIEILRTAIGDDGTLVADNRIENIKAGPGGSGQYGNAINAFRAGNVIVRGNRIRNCDYSAVRGNSASNIHISGNSVSDVREVALYSEFAFEAAVIANNIVDGAAVGVSVCNFNEGGRIAVVQGNIIRNLIPKRPIGTAPDDDAGVGIYIEADTSVTAQRDRECAVLRHRRRLGQISARRRDHGQRDPQGLRGGRRLRRAGRRHRAGQQQHDLGDPAGRRRRPRSRACRDLGSVGRRRATICAGGARRECGAKIGVPGSRAVHPSRLPMGRVASHASRLRMTG